VLIVEDEDSIRNLARQILASAGYKVLTAGSSAEARRLSLTHRDDIHLLLTDVVLPTSNGGELAARLCGMRPRLKVLYMSGHTPEFVVARGVVAAGMNFIAKPFSPEDLQFRVRELLDTDAVRANAQA
jgi:two-component system, cell cycle sensor histidine kinase and response regulator CckA